MKRQAKETSAPAEPSLQDILIAYGDARQCGVRFWLKGDQVGFIVPNPALVSPQVVQTLSSPKARIWMSGYVTGAMDFMHAQGRC
jgi:hypothetical protein